MTNSQSTLHAHVSTAAADCDGPIFRDYVVGLSEEEIAEAVHADGVNDFSEIHFMNRVFANLCGPFAVYQMRVVVDDSGFEWNETTDEGYRNGEVRWCRTADCDPNAYSQRDVYAEMMGY